VLIPVKNIASLQSGIYVNVSTARGDTIYYLQVRHWNKQRNWSHLVRPELRKENKFNKNYLKPGDILLATKGTDLFAAVYDGYYSPAIASSVFTVLRIKDTNTVLPAYLQWYLNHPSTTKKLTAASKGTSMPMITRDIIEQLELPIPSLEKQRMILLAQDMQRRAMQLRSRIDQLNKTIFHFNLLQTANQS
jgi:restriction endonuclease S subunit